MYFWWFVTFRSSTTTWIATIHLERHLIPLPFSSQMRANGAAFRFINSLEWKKSESYHKWASTNQRLQAILYLFSHFTVHLVKKRERSSSLNVFLCFSPISSIFFIFARTRDEKKSVLNSIQTLGFRCFWSFHFQHSTYLTHGFHLLPFPPSFWQGWLSFRVFLICQQTKKLPEKWMTLCFCLN